MLITKAWKIMIEKRDTGHLTSDQLSLLIEASTIKLSSQAHSKPA